MIEFAFDAPPVTKIFLSIGANDIHHAKCRVQHLKTPVASLLKTAKDLFPRAKIWVQSILPIPLQRKFMINDVCDMNGEILPANTYKLFRLDRSRKTHPIDPDNPKKFREKGGGVLIAVRADLDAESKVIVSSCKAELLSLELDLGEKEFLVVSNCYRVGMLGDSNFAEIEKQLLLISKKQKYKRHVLVGDFNLNSVTWEVSYGITSSRLESKFLELFDNNGFGQCVDKPTPQDFLCVMLGDCISQLLKNLPTRISQLFGAAHICFLVLNSVRAQVF